MAFPPETALRTCLLGVRIGQELSLSQEELSDVFYVTLLRHLGCTALSHEEGIVAGDDIAWRRDFTGVDYRQVVPLTAMAVVRMGAGQGPLGRLRAFTVGARTLGMSKVALAHCDASRRLASQLGMSAGVIKGLDDIFERWDGKGWPSGLKTDAISLPARLTHFSHTVILELWRRAASAALAMVRRRAGHEFDPGLADAFLHRSRDLLEPVVAASVWDATLDAEPPSRPWLPVSRVDDIAQAFAYFSDLKSPFMLGHCQGVARLVVAGARGLALKDADVSALHRSALLHNLGRLAIANGILDKPAPLNPAEWERLRLYPYYTERVIARPAILRPLAPLTSSVQERLDGSGYHRRLPAAMLSREARLLAAADVYQAMIEERPQRPALAVDAAAHQLSAEVDAGRLDREAVDCVLEAAGQPRLGTSRSWPAGLTDREVEVLRRVARAKPNKAIARELVISEETVRNHVRHIYEKISVSSRAGAALFAMEHDLIRN